MRTKNKSSSKGKSVVTRLNRLHPYPAMVADELAISLAHRFVAPKSRVLDPFCGSGRLLAAVEDAEIRIGLDVNPLAWLLTTTKLSNIDGDKILLCLNRLDEVKNFFGKPLPLASTRKVAWFSTISLNELSAIIHWINTLKLEPPELFLMASVLSATTRDVSYARKAGWKLHRQSKEARATFYAPAIECFQRRLSYCAKLLQSDSAKPSEDNFHVEVVSSSDADTLRSISGKFGPFDTVITSPPYGDSTSTVQYGAASSLCLETVRHLHGLEHLFRAGAFIDGSCLGGTLSRIEDDIDVAKWWDGPSQSTFANSLRKFLGDYKSFCTGVADCLGPGGRAILIVGRRSTGGHKVRLDSFTIDVLLENHFTLISREKRLLQQKRFPSRINRYARSRSEANRETGAVLTMEDEIILVFEKE
jgi:site-specific DNA-methyltransferase (cytosine-N4-specific)